MTSIEERAAYTNGLRAIADLLDAHPDVKLPIYRQFDFFAYGSDEDVREASAAFVRAVPGTVAKKYRDSGTASYLDLEVSFHGFVLSFTVERDAVCTRRVVAVREVTSEVPDPDALAAVPTVTVTETVEDVEWDCHPLLASSAVAS